MEFRSELENPIRRFGREFFNQTKELRDDPVMGRYRDAINWAQTEAENRSWEYLDTGGQRIAIRIPNGLTNGKDAVLKAGICRDSARDGRYQNAMEIALWQQAPDQFKEFLAPIVAYGGSYRFVVMPYAEPLDNDTDIVPTRNPITREFRIATNEFAAQNWGRIDGNPVLIDYGHGVIEGVLEEDQIPNIEDYAPEFAISGSEQEENTEEDEEDEEDLAGVDASRVQVFCPDVRPYEKPDLKKALWDTPVWEGLDLEDEIEEFEGEIKDTEPTSGSGFGESQVIVTQDTLIRIDSE